MIIGDKYYIEDPESGQLHRCSKEYYDDYHKRRDALMAMVSSRINPESKLQAGIVLVSTRPFGDYDEDFTNIWRDAEEEAKPGQLYRYFTPHQQPDKYGHAILPTGLRENTDDAISAARLQFPKTEDDAFRDKID